MIINRPLSIIVFGIIETVVWFGFDFRDWQFLTAHLSIVISLFTFLCLAPGQERSVCRKSFALFAAIICLFAPVAGFLCAALILFFLQRSNSHTESEIEYIIGNPLRNASAKPADLSGIKLRPIINALASGDYEEVIDGISIIKDAGGQIFAMRLLKRARDESNAIGSLHANAAINVITEEMESELSQVAKSYRAQKTNEDLALHYVHHLEKWANSGTSPKNELIKSLRQAVEILNHLPDSSEKSLELSKLYIQLQDNDSSFREIEKIDQTKSNASAILERKVEVLNLKGNWKTIGQIVVEAVKNPLSAQFTSRIRAFWAPYYHHE